MPAALGLWRIDAKAYMEDILAGSGGLEFIVGPGLNTVKIPMIINGGYFDINLGAFPGGVLQASPPSAFPGTLITLTATPNTGYELKAGSLKYRYGGADYTPGGSGPLYTVTMPASDVTVRAEFSRQGGGDITIEGPQDKIISISAVHSAAGPVPAGDVGRISFAAGESITFTVDSGNPPRYTVEAGNLLWVGDIALSGADGNSLTVNARNYAVRKYTIVVAVQEDGQWYSATVVFEVTG
jgi:hypothetical protein